MSKTQQAFHGLKASPRNHIYGEFMNIRPLAIFAAGAIFSTAVLGTTTWLQASSDNTITACVNKKTGTMRYLTKGKCNRKAETQVSWSSTGPTGPTGETGPRGPKGETGPEGKKAMSGAVVDARGAIVGIWSSSSTGDTTFIGDDGGLWTAYNSVANFPTGLQYFRDSRCSIPLLDDSYNTASLPSPFARWVLAGAPGTVNAYNAVSGWKAKNEPSFPASTLPELYSTNGNRPCFLISRPDSVLGDYSDLYFWNGEEVPLPSYVPPLSVRFE